MKKDRIMIICFTVIATMLICTCLTADASKAKKVKNKLTKAKWYCVECVDGDVGRDPFSQYGSVVNTCGAYIKFGKNKKFHCTLGLNSCKGKYEISKKGKVTLYITKKWAAGSVHPKIGNMKRKLRVFGNYKSIAFNCFGVKNRFEIRKK